MASPRGRRRPHRAGHARRPARSPPQEAQGGRCLSVRAGDAHARRPRRPQRPRHRTLRGPDPIKVGKAPHDCVALEYAGGNKLYVPVENIDLLTRYGNESEGVGLDRLGGEGWQRRKSRMKERIREIAGELIKTAAIRATRPGAVIEPDSAYPAVCRPLPLRRDGRPRPRHRGSARGSRVRYADGSAGLRRCRLRQNGGRTSSRVRRRHVGNAGRDRRPTTLLARQHYRIFTERSRVSRSASAVCRGWCP